MRMSMARQSSQIPGAAPGTGAREARRRLRSRDLMATVARTVRRLSTRDSAAVLVLLDGDPVTNAFLRSELRLGALSGGGWWGVGRGGLISAALVAGPLVIPCVPDEEDAVLLAGVLDRHS